MTLETNEVPSGRNHVSEKLEDEMKGPLKRAAEGYAKRMRDGEKIGVSTIYSKTSYQ
jgi:hypothetical protein